MPRETYAAARIRLFNALRANGWTVKYGLKIPQAIPPGHDRPAFVLFFTPQAVRMNDHSLWLDIRDLPLSTFLDDVERTCKVRGIAWTKGA